MSVLLAYGVPVLLALVGSSGVIGTLTAGIVISSRWGSTNVSAESRFAVTTMWETLAIIANTIIFVAIGIVTPFGLIIEYGAQIIAAIVVVFLARAVVIYPPVGLLNRIQRDAIPRSYQHVLTWSGIHASVSIALVLGVAAELSGPLTEQLLALVFGVAGFSLLVNSPTMGRLIDWLDVT